MVLEYINNVKATKEKKERMKDDRGEKKVYQNITEATTLSLKYVLQFYSFFTVLFIHIIPSFIVPLSAEQLIFSINIFAI